MSTTNIIFIFCFLPISLVLYYLVRDEVKEYVLLVISLLFYAFGSLDFFLLFLFSIIVNIIIGRSIASTHICRKQLRYILLTLGILYNVSLLVYYKYTNFVLSIYGNFFHKDVTLRNIVLPLGISFFTFKSISYLVDIFKRQIELSANPIHDALYLSFFTQIISGPLSRYDDMHNIIISSNKQDKFALFSEGVYRFILGFNKKILLANVLSNITTEIFSSPFATMSSSYAWLGSICYSMQLFFDFAGYSDMAIGLSEMFGYSCPENFNYPYMTSSISKFWRRWHISLSQWFRDYIYFPLGGSRVNKKYRIYLNLFVVWTLTGIWHGSAWNFVFWGLGYFILISFEKATGLPDKLNSKILKTIYRILTLLFINFQWVMFRADNIIHGLKYIKHMFFCEPNPLTDARTLFLIKDYFIFILFALLFCFPVIPWIEQKTEKNKMLHTAFQAVLMIATFALFMWAVSFVVSGQNNPFAYANF